MMFKLWSGQRTKVETQLFGPYVGRTLTGLQKKQTKTQVKTELPRQHKPRGIL
ncbi:hypothetical protein Hanom_Chr12g01159931 [Helianthus anomalus]